MDQTALNEEWRQMPGYEGIYDLSNKGQVKSLQRTFKMRWATVRVPERILKQEVSNTGYLRVVLYDGKTRKKFSVHRLVCTVWHDNPNQLPEVNHIDGIKTNNCSTNLEWVGRPQNQNHAYANRLQEIKTGSQCKHAKLNEEKVKDIRSLYAKGGIKQKEIATQYGVSASQISDIINKKRAGWLHV